MLSGSFSTSQVLAVTGATARQLQWWDEHSLVVPLREGRKRLYSASDLADILVILELRRRHISLQQVRRVLRFLKQELRVRLADLVAEEADRPLPEYHLLIDGSRLYLETDSRQIFDLLKSTDQAVFLVSLGTAVKKLQLAGFTLTGGETPPRKKPAKRDTQSTSTRKEKSRIRA
jgi:DNA-binding transcriptional MerR regulator